jgi:CRP-like cAMP-binding protein
MSLYSEIHDRSSEAKTFLAGLPLFEGLSQEELSQIADSLQRRSFAAEVVLFHQDMPGIMLYMIQEGFVRVFSIGRTGQELTFEIFGPGDIFGELSLLDDHHHSATAVTLSQSIVWLLPKPDLEDCLNRFPGVARAMNRILVKRVRSRAKHTESLTFLDVLGRLAIVMLDLAEKHGHPVEDAVEIQVPLTQVDLANMVSATREGVNRAVRTLRDQGLVNTDGTQWTVLSPRGLLRVVRERGN